MTDKKTFQDKTEGYLLRKGNRVCVYCCNICYIFERVREEDVHLSTYVMKAYRGACKRRVVGARRPPPAALPPAARPPRGDALCIPSFTAAKKNDLRHLRRWIERRSRSEKAPFKMRRQIWEIARVRGDHLSIDV